MTDPQRPSDEQPAAAGRASQSILRPGSWEQELGRTFARVRLDTIRAKLVAFGVLAALVPAVATALLFWYQNRRTVAARISESLTTTSAQAADGLNIWVRERVYELHVFSSSYEVTENLDRLERAPDPVASAHLLDYLSSVKPHFADYSVLVVVDPAGRTVASSAGRIPPLALPRDWERRLRTEDAVFGTPYRDSVSGRTLMIVAVPIAGPRGRLLGALAATTNLSAAAADLPAPTHGDLARAYVIDDSGRVILRGPLAPGGRLRPAALRTLRVAEGAADYRAPDDSAAVGMMHPVQRLDWSVVTEIPAAVAYAEIRHARNLTILLLGALLVVLGTLAFGLGAVIGRPLGRIAAAARRVGHGDLKVDVPVVGGGELGELTAAFNDMVARLRDGRRALDAASEALRAKNVELERLSVTDALTGLFNRRHLLGALADEENRARRHKRAFAVLMIDIDGFKEYNDRYGHPAGDEALRLVAEALKAVIRDVDMAARYGGEEFAVLLSESTLEQARTTAERARRRVAQAAVPHEPVTVSVGVAVFPKHGDSGDAVLASADAALYQAKRAGRDRVACFSAAADAADDPPSDPPPPRRSRSPRRG